SFAASTSTATPTGYTWSYGDNTNDVGKSVTHAYAAAGNYVVTLTITKPGTGNGCFSGTCVSQATKTVVVGGGGRPPLDPEFTTSGATCPNQFALDECGAPANPTVTLTARSSVATSFAWDFGDATTGSDPPVTHAWAQAGSYTVKL